MVLTLSDIKDMVVESLHLLSENKTYRNMKKARNAIRKYCKVSTEDEVWEVLNTIRGDMPYSRIYDERYLAGLVRMVYGEELETPQIDMLNTILEILSSNQLLANRYNSDFNGLYYEDLAFQFHNHIIELNQKERNELLQQQLNNSQYTIVPIRSFEEASRYSAYTDWCITKSEYDFKNYTMHGQSFYFCLKKGFETLQKPQNISNTPFDDYGLSMIAVSVYSNGRLATCTTRWNAATNGGKEITPKELSNIVGANFFDTFKPF